MKRFLLITTLVSIVAFWTPADEFVRHKHLVEHFTSQGCAYCPWGDHVLELLTEMRDDIARVSVHCNQGTSDEFRTFKCDGIANYLGVTEMPTAAFDRTPFQNVFMQVISAYPEYHQAKAEFFSEQIDSNVTTPVLADVVIDAIYNDTTRVLQVNINGDVTDDFHATFGNEVALTVYIIEDSLVAKQLNQTTWIQDFVHNNVLRDALSNYKGDALKWNDERTHYTHSYKITLKNNWTVENLSIVAFVSRNATAHREVINCQMLHLRDLSKPTVVGDVTGDGTVDIADVNAVINILLGIAEKFDAADVSGDGAVDIGDVNAIINILLGMS